MTNLVALWNKLLFYARRDQFDADLREEMRFHLEKKIEANRAAGMPPQAARHAALREFGNENLLREVSRDMWAFRFIETLIQDLRYAGRVIVKNPGFTAIAVLTLTLGIGANTAIFSVVNTVLLQPLPYKQPDRIVILQAVHPKREDQPYVAPADWTDWQARNTVFEAIAAMTDVTYTLTNAGDPETIISYSFSSNTFGLFGVNAALGRTFLPEEDRPGHDQVAVISHALWQRHFSGDKNIVGKSITLNDKPYTVVGVMPASFTYPNAELWTPLGLDAATMSDRKGRFLRLVARLKPEVTLKQAQAEMTTITRDLEQRYPDTNAGLGVRTLSLEQESAKDVRRALLVLLGVVGLVLLIACANLANLLLARAAARQKEIAIRAALGASRLRLIRQFLTESMLLSLLGAAGGLLLTYWSTNSLLALFPKHIANLNIPKVQAINIDGRVFGFTLLVAVVTGILFGLAPALQSGRAGLNEALKDGGRSATGGPFGARLRQLLVISEIALTLMLLIGAGLLIKSFVRLSQGNLGFNPNNVVTLYVFLRPEHAEGPKASAFVEQILQRAASLPGARSVGAVDFLPLSGFMRRVPFQAEGAAPSLPGEELRAEYRSIAKDYFKTVEIHSLFGREFTEFDRDGAPPVAVINETMARRFFGSNAAAIGKRLKLGRVYGPNQCEIVGVVNDTRASGPDQPAQPEIYRPYNQSVTPFIAFTVRTDTDPASMGAALKREIWAMDKDQPIDKVVTLDQLAADSLTLRRVSMILTGALAGLAVILAIIGIYGITSYMVAQRTHEIGIRVALGAQAGDILRMIVKQGMVVALIGVAFGLVGALATTRLITSLLFGVSATDPTAFATLAVLLTAVAGIACYIPARRATAVDPLVALRYE